MVAVTNLHCVGGSGDQENLTTYDKDSSKRAKELLK